MIMATHKRIFTFLFLSFFVMGCADYKEARQARKDGDYQKALTQLTELSEFGHAPSQVELARMYIRGEGIAKQPEKALPLLESAAAKGEKKAYFELGRLYERGAGTRQNTTLAIENYRLAAKAGYPQAAFYWARMLERGKVTPRDIPAAMSLYEASARAGYSRAALALAPYIAERGLLPDMDHSVDKDIYALALYYAALVDDREVPSNALNDLEDRLSEADRKKALSITETRYSGTNSVLPSYFLRH